MHQVVRNIHLITNPAGGTRNNRELSQIAASFFQVTGINVQISFTEHIGHAIKLAQAIPYSPDAIVCALGGDGTMHEIINGIMHCPEKERLPIASLPGGTGNSFMEDMGLLDFDEALKTIAHATVKKIDLFEIHLDDKLHYVFNVCGWGLFASGNACAESLRCLKQHRYNVAGLWEIIRNRGLRTRFTFHHQTIEDQFSLIVASNTRYVGKSMLLSPHAHWNDGKLDLTFLKHTTRLALVRMFLKLHSGQHIHEPNIHYLQTDAFEIHSSKATLWNLDGEKHLGKVGKVKVLPSALRVCMPPTAKRREPNAAHSESYRYKQ